MKSLQEILLGSVLKEAETKEIKPFIPNMMLAFSHIFYDITTAGYANQENYNKSGEGFIGIITKMIYEHLGEKPKDSFGICVKDAISTPFSVALYDKAKFIHEKLRIPFFYRGLYEYTKEALNNYEKLLSIAIKKYESSKEIIGTRMSKDRNKTFEQAVIEALGSNSHLTESYKSETLVSYITPHIIALYLQATQGQNIYHNMGKEAQSYLTRKLSIELKSIKDTPEKGNTKEEKVNTVINDIIDAFRTTKFNLDYFNTDIDGKTIPLVLLENWKNIFSKRGIFIYAQEWAITPDGRRYLNQTLGNSIRTALL